MRAGTGSACMECGSKTGRKFVIERGPLGSYMFCSDCIVDSLLSNSYGLADLLESTPACENCGEEGARLCRACGTPSCENCGTEFDLSIYCSDCLYDWGNSYAEDYEHEHYCDECGMETDTILCSSCIASQDEEEKDKNEHVVISDGVISLDGVEINFTI